MTDGQLKPLLKTRGAVFSRPGSGRTAALDLAVLPSELVVLTGAAAAGKSEVLRCLVGISLHLEGEISVLGHRARDLDHDGWMAVRARVAYASVTAPLLANLSVRDNLTVPLVMRGMDGDEAERRADELLVAHALMEHAGARPHRLPHSALRQALLARALLVPAELFVLDEPLRTLDKATAAGWQEEIERRRAAGAGVIVSSAEPERWAGLCTRVVEVGAPNGRESVGE